jgi:hypothetical protein
MSMFPSFPLALPLASLALIAAAPVAAPPLAVTTVADVTATPAPIAADGWRFKWKVTVQSEQKGVPATPSMTVSLVAGKARMDYEGEVNQPGMKKGGYMILDADKGTMTMVSPEDKKAMIMDPAAIGNAMGAMGASGMVKMEVADAKVDVESLGAGESILGYPTKRYRISRSHTMNVSVMGRKNSSKESSVSEVWMADKFIEDKAFEAWAKNFARGMGSMGGDAMKQLMELEQAKMPKGIALKSVTTSTSTDPKGKAVATTMTMEMQELKKTSFDASLFEVPAGYEVVDMKAQLSEASASMEQAKADCEKEHGKGSEKCDMSKVGASLDSAMKTGAKAGAKEGAADAAKKTLKGLFKKKP